MPDPANLPTALTTAQLWAIILGSGGAAALFTKSIELLDARFVRAKGENRERAVSSRSIAEHLELYAFGCAGYMYATWDVLENGAPGPMMRDIPEFPAYPATINWQVIGFELADAAS